MSFAQLEALGMSTSERLGRVRMGAFEPVGSGVLRIAGSTETFEQRCLAAVLDAGPAAVASRHTAAALAGLDGFARPGRRVTIHVTVLRPGRPKRRPAIVVHRTTSLPASDVVRIRRVPCTSMARTLIDLAAHVEVSDEGLADAIDSALRDGLLAEEVLRRRIALLRGSGRAGVRRLERLLEGRPDGGTKSTLERAFLKLCEAAGLPRPSTQVVVRRPSGDIDRVDFLFVGAGVVVEGERPSDTLEPSSTRGRCAAPARPRYRGLTVLEFTGDEVFGRPARVVDELHRYVRSLIA